MICDQTEFGRALLNPGVARPQGLTNGRDLPAGQRFDVYRNNVAVSLTEALETAFPIIQKLVGEGNFKVLAGAFLRAFPPTCPVMMFYGEEMPDFLKSFGPTVKIGYLPDLARLEVALRESYHAADTTPLNPDTLQALGPDALMMARLILAPSVRLIRSEWPIHAVWRVNTQTDAPKPIMHAQDVLILRPEYDPQPHLLPQGGGEFMAALLSGESLGSAVGKAGEGFDLTATLALLLRAGAITGIEG